MVEKGGFELGILRTISYFALHYFHEPNTYLMNMISHMLLGLLVQRWKGKERCVSSSTSVDLLLVSRSCNGLLSNYSDFGALDRDTPNS